MLRVQPFTDLGTPVELVRSFGGRPQYLQALAALERELYAQAQALTPTPNLNVHLTPVIKSIQDVMRQDAGINGDAQRIEQMVWLLFLKVFDALEEELELTRDDYRARSPTTCAGGTGPLTRGHHRRRCWTSSTTRSSQTQEPGRRPGAQPARLGGARRLRDANNFMKSGQLLRQVINKLGRSTSTVRPAPPVQRSVREDPARPAERRQRGRVLPAGRHAVHGGRVNPRLGERCSIRPPAPAVFLVCAIEHLRKQVKNTEQEALLQNSIGGVEKKQLPHMLCVTNLMLHGVGAQPRRARQHAAPAARDLRRPSAWTWC